MIRWASRLNVLGLGIIVTVFSQPVRAAETAADRLPTVTEVSRVRNRDYPVTTINEWQSQLSQVQTPVQVTEVKLTKTADGISVSLNTATGVTLEPITREEGNTLIAEIANAVLALPEGKEFRAEKPLAGIASVTVTQVGTSIRVSVTGEDAVPLTDVVPDQQGLTLSVEADELEIELVVTATRTEETVQNVPRSVTVIEREQIQEQATVSRDLTDILGKLVPGAGPPTGIIRNQGLRGRGTQVLIDGVPITSNDSNVGFQRDIRSISPDAVERVEVVRGASAVFGDGATGGVINIITRRASGQRLQSETKVGVDASLSNLQGDSFGNLLSHSISITEGKSDLFIQFSRRDTGIAYDAEGDRIPYEENTAETETLQALGKIGVDFDANQRLQLTASFNRDRTNPSITADPLFNNPPFERKARATDFNPTYIDADEPETVGAVVSLDYSHRNVFGSKLNAQVYYRYNKIIPLYFDERIFDPDSIISGRNAIDDRLGGRLQIETPIFKTASLLSGVDYSKAHLEDESNIFDPVDFDNSGGRILRKIGQRTFYPRFSIENLGLFGQLQWDLSPQWILSGGLRYERFKIDVPDFTNFTLDAIGGGKRSLDDVVFNVGIVYQTTENISLYTNFAQGFSLPPIARILFSNASEGFRFDRDVDLSEPQKVNNYELGIRGNWETVQASLAAFYTEFDLGTSLIANPNNPSSLLLARAPQRNYGVEASLDWQPGKNWQLGATFTWQEGEEDIDNDEVFTAQSSGIVSPLKLTAYVQHQTAPGWQNRLQALYVADRSKGFEAGVEFFPVESYFVVDYISSIEIGGGYLDIGIENLLNQQYVTAGGGFGFDLGGNFYKLPARGTTLRATYRITW